MAAVTTPNTTTPALPASDDDVLPREVNPPRLLPTLRWLRPFERRLAARIPVHANVLSALKLVVVTPLLLWALWRGPALAGQVALCVSLLIAFALLDYLDGVVARGKGQASAFGRVFDRVTDYPLLLGLSSFCLDVIPMPLIALKLGLDALVLLLFALGRGSTENRVRTVLSDGTLFGLLALGQGWLPGVVTPAVVMALLWLGIGLSALVALHNVGVLRRRRVADLLSLGNLICGLSAMALASRGHFELGFATMALGLAFDGFDGAAARRWGGSRYGVYADDVADGVNFALAPAVAIAYALGGAAGVAVGSLYALCAVGRLVFFTLDKSSADPRFFKGIPSPAGAVIVWCAVLLFRDSAALLGLCAGMASVLMIAFGTRYKHLGRWLARHRGLLPIVPLAALALVGAGLVWGAEVPASFALVVCLGYSLWPAAVAMAQAARPPLAPC